MSPPTLAGRRTNSLAFARTDCHTCTATQARCDRQRPRCSACSGKNVICGGYPMQLIWSKTKLKQPSNMLSLEHVDDPFYIEPLSHQVSLPFMGKSIRARSRKCRQYTFVSGHAPGQKRNPTGTSGAHSKQSRSNHEGKESQSINSIQSTIIECADRQRSPESVCKLAKSSLATEDEVAMDHGHPPVISGNLQGAITKIGSPILYQCLFGKFEALLNMYDRDFCVVPLSGDVLSNPFRCRSETCRGSRTLLHAIIAVSSFHAGRKSDKESYPSLLDHRNTAIKLYHDELYSSKWVSSGPQLLDTSMVLFLLNATQAAFNDWAIQISRAFTVLQLSGGLQRWIGNRRIQAQVVMLLWWDATIALISRQGPILPYSYFESLLALEDDKYWNFFSLIGCPRQLVVPLMQLARLAEENEKATSMHRTKLDLTLVNEIQASIINWKNPAPEFNDRTSEEHIHKQHDEWNCIEAWRHGLLIYIMRVFQWDRSMSPPLRIVTCARRVFDHVYSCRQTAIVQKQVLIPLFFAGCETKDQYFQQKILDYCKHWDYVSGYNLFNTAASLLGDIWLEQDGSPGVEVWWGSVVDKKQLPSQFQTAPMQFCFG